MVDPVANVDDDEDESGTGHLKAGWSGWFQLDRRKIETSTQVPEAVFKNKGTKGKKDEEGEGGDCEKSLDEETQRKLDALEHLAPLRYQIISNQMVVPDELQSPTCLKPSPLRFKQKACNMVRTHVKLIVEEALVLSWVSILSPAIVIDIFLQISGQRAIHDYCSVHDRLSQMEGGSWPGNEPWLFSLYCSIIVESIGFLGIIHIQVEVQPSPGIGVEGVEI